MLAGCVSGADPSGRVCPCAEAAGYACCLRSGRCVPRAEAEGAACALDSSPADAGRDVASLTPDAPAAPPDAASEVPPAADTAAVDALSVDAALAADATADLGPEIPPDAGGAEAGRSCVEESAGVRAAYYSSPDFTGQPLVRTEGGLVFDWGDGAPAMGIATDPFSALFSARLTVDESDDYTLFVSADDGFRLWLDGQLLLDWWRVSSRPLATTVSLEGRRPHALAIEYVERVSKASLAVEWQRAGAARGPIPACQLAPAPATPSTCPSAPLSACVPPGAAPCLGAGRGLLATYHRFPGFDQVVHSQVDAPVEYDHSWIRPDQLYTERFTARWEGELEAPTTDRYTLYLISEGHAEVTLAGQRAATVFEDAASREAVMSVLLTGGQRYPIRIQYLDGHAAGWSSLQLRWRVGSGPKSAIPTCHLFAKPI